MAETCKIPFANILAPTPEEIQQILSALDKVKEEVEKQGKVELLRNIEQLLDEKINDFYSFLSKDSQVFVLIREEDWKWVIARKPEIGKKVYLLKTRAEFNRPVLLLSNKPM